MLTGQNPDKTEFRDPFCKVKSKMISEILKNVGYKTAGFVGIDFLSKKHGFAKGFDVFDEPTDETSWNTKKYKRGKLEMDTNWGNWWVERMLDWIKENHSNNFFIWGHYFEVHFLAEKRLLFENKIERDNLSDWAYYDAKIKYMDEWLIQGMIKTLKNLDIWDNTSIIITSDHGETLGTRQPNWETFYFDYPQHKTMYECDLKIPLIIKSRKLKRKVIDHSVRGIDIVPTILDLLDINSGDKECDGTNLMPLIEGDSFPELTTYSEELFRNRGAGSLQSVSDSKYKFIRNITKNTEELYNLQKDSNEKENIINSANTEEKTFVRQSKEIMEKMYSSYQIKVAFTVEDRTESEKEKIKKLVKTIDNETLKIEKTGRKQFN
jgi:arylsulfatase A-like enzyme